MVTRAHPRSSWPDWLPTLAAGVLAAAMLWLAGAPFDPWVEGALPALRLIGVQADLGEFPTDFEWDAAPGAEFYEISVVRIEAPNARDAAGNTLIFRQRGTGTTLALEFDDGFDPGPGQYLWEVRAARAGRDVAMGKATFRVASGAAPR